MGFFRKMNEHYFNLFQIVYDWIWDSLGIYLGTVFMAASAVELSWMWVYRETKFSFFFCGAIDLWIAGWFFWVQSSRVYELQNRGALKWRNGIGGYFVWFFALSDLAEFDHGIVAGCWRITGTLLVWGFLLVLLRDRRERKRESFVKQSAIPEPA